MGMRDGLWRRAGGGQAVEDELGEEGGCLGWQLAGMCEQALASVLREGCGYGAWARRQGAAAAAT